MEKILADFTASLQELFMENLLAVVLYGSAVRGEYRKGVSDINVLILLEKSSPPVIFEMGRSIKPFLRRHRINPLVMTGEEFRLSADIFPLEYADIRDTHRVIYGDAKILNIDLHHVYLRYELEEKLRGAVGDIRHMLLASGGSENNLAMRLVSWSGLCGTIFRGLLRLKGISDIPVEADALLKRVSDEYSIPLDGFAAFERFRGGEKAQAVELAASMLNALKALASAVSAMPCGEPG